MSSDSPRHILHVDMDGFFAAIEQLDHPELRGKPVLVGGSPEGRGVVSTASYEARPFGCHSAMPMAQALRLCPQAIVVPPRTERYAELSERIFEILEQFTPLLEPLSIDEGFLDITGSQRLLGSAEQIACELKRRIHAETKLTASVGLAPNKFLAKLASDLDKPDGLVIVPADHVQEFLDPLPIHRLWGVGKVTLRRFEELRVSTFADLRRMTLDELRHELGEAGEHFHHLVRGDDDRPVVPDREAKSISHEQTFATDLTDRDYLRSVLLNQTEDVARRLRRHELLARTVTVKIRRYDFHTITRRTTLAAPTDQTEVIWQAAADLFEQWATTSSREQRDAAGPQPVRLLGVGVAQLVESQGQQLTLFDEQDEKRRRALDRTLDEIRDRYGHDAIARGQAPRRESRQPP
jgi:DNA polymerase-4